MILSAEFHYNTFIPVMLKRSQMLQTKAKAKIMTSRPGISGRYWTWQTVHCFILCKIIYKQLIIAGGTGTHVLAFRLPAMAYSSMVFKQICWVKSGQVYLWSMEVHPSGDFHPLNANSRYHSCFSCFTKLDTVKPLMFACPLLHKFRKPNKMNCPRH